MNIKDKNTRKPIVYTKGSIFLWWPKSCNFNLLLKIISMSDSIISRLDKLKKNLNFHVYTPCTSAKFELPLWKCYLGFPLRPKPTLDIYRSTFSSHVNQHGEVPLMCFHLKYLFIYFLVLLHCFCLFVLCSLILICLQSTYMYFFNILIIKNWHKFVK